MPKVKEILEFIDKIAPFDKQESWDNSGFLIGDEDCEVTKAVIALDCTPDVLDYAKENGCQLIITHHPVIFRAVKGIFGNSIVHTAIKYDLSVISAHTSYDVAVDGVSDILASTLGLKNIEKSAIGVLTIGNVEETTVEEFAKIVKEKLNANIRLCNNKKTVKRVAVCGGAGSDFLKEAQIYGADLLVTGDAGHHDFLDALSLNMGLIAAGHHETEIIAMTPLTKKLQNVFLDVEFICYNQKSPITYI